MAELAVKFSDSSFKSSAKKLVSSYDNRYNDYEGIRKNLNSIPTNRSNLSTSGNYLNRKLNAIDNRRDSINSFKSSVAEFCDDAKDVDKRVANRIKSESKSVYKILGIKTGASAIFSTLCHVALDILVGIIGGPLAVIAMEIARNWSSIKAWYKNSFVPWWNNGGKYIVTAVVFAVLTVVSCGTALAATSVLAIVVGVFAVATNFTIAASNSIAVYLHYSGDKDMAKEISEIKLRDVFAYYGEKIGGETGRKVGVVLHDGLAVFSAVYSLYKIGGDMLKALKLNGKLGKYFSPKYSFAQKRNWFRMTNWSAKFSRENVLKALKIAIGFDTKGIKQSKVLKIQYKWGFPNASSARSFLELCKDFSNIKTGFTTIKDIAMGNYLDAFKVTKKIKSIYTNLHIGGETAAAQ